MDLSTVAGIVQNVTTSLAVVVGAVWAYYRFIRTGEFKLRLEPQVQCSVSEGSSVYVVQIAATLKNVGGVKVPLTREGTMALITVCREPPDVEFFEDVDWTNESPTRLFRNHEWIESMETVSEKLTLIMPKADLLGVRVQLHIVAEGGTWIAEDIHLFTRTLERSGNNEKETSINGGQKKGKYEAHS